MNTYYLTKGKRFFGVRKYHAIDLKPFFLKGLSITENDFFSLI